MTKRAVVLVRSDPRESHRACEGVRVALGLAATEHHVDIIFADNGPWLLSPDVEDLIDEELAIKYLTTLKEFVPVFFIDQGSTSRIDLTDGDYETIHLSKEEVASKIAATDWFAVF